MTEPWKLTDEGLKQLLWETTGLIRPPDTRLQGVMGSCFILGFTAAQKKLLDYLSSQVGPYPCETCELSDTSYDIPYCTFPCMKFYGWCGQQQGYAKGQKDLAKEWITRLEKEDEIICAGFLKTWAEQKGLQERGK